jgi:hypothetical protein
MRLRCIKIYHILAYLQKEEGKPNKADRFTLYIAIEFSYSSIAFTELLWKDAGSTVILQTAGMDGRKFIL